MPNKIILNLPPTPDPWKNCLPQSWSLVPKRLRTAALEDIPASNFLLMIHLSNSQIAKMEINCRITSYIITLGK